MRENPSQQPLDVNGGTLPSQGPARFPVN